MRLDVPLYLNDEHRAEHDRLIEKAWRARVWMRMNKIRRAHERRRKEVKRER